MFYAVLAGVLIFAGIIAFEDLKRRAVSIISLTGFSVFLIAYSLFQFPLQQIFFYFLFNLAFLLLQALFLSLYYYIRYRDLKKLPASIGAADIWMFVALAVAFEPTTFIFFLTASFVIALLFFVITTFVLKKEMREIPLAGILSICYIALTVIPELRTFLFQP